MECIFCKIIKKEIPAEIIFEDKTTIVFKDIHPRAPIHFLILPKKHIASIKDLKSKDQKLMGNLFLVAKKIAKAKKLPGFKLVVNVGRPAGQLIEHLHLHFLAGRPIKMP